MDDLRKAAEMALEALDGWSGYDKWVWPESALEQAKKNTAEAIQALRQELAQPEQEPVAWIVESKHGNWAPYLEWSEPSYLETQVVTPLYTAPPKREWVGLKGDEISECWKTGNVVAAVEAKLKEKNT